jgi:hypothetical protein
MGRKGLVEPIDQGRNGIPMRSMGDKSYKNPEYAPGFYKEGGLIAGSTVKPRKLKKGEMSMKKMKGPLFPGRLTWKEKEEISVHNDELKAVKELFEWEKHTLKEANPKWRDPDDFDIDIPQKVEDPKNNKKSGRK